MQKTLKRSTISKGIRKTLKKVGAQPIDGGPLDQGIETFAKTASKAVSQGTSIFERARRGASKFADRARDEIHEATKPRK